jgi:S-DNA-T family DNA segregation ATPase FtsK/SpoIIIE
VSAPRRVELRLTYVPAAAAPRDVFVRADDEARVADLSQALARHVGAPSANGLHNRRSGPLPEQLRLGDGRLRDGDVLFDGEPPAEPAARRAETDLEVAIVGGPGAGRRIPLGRGVTVVGRDPGCEVVIDDPSLSWHHAKLTMAAEGVVVSDAGSTNGTAVEGVRVKPGEERPLGEHEHVEVGRSLLRVGARLRTDETVAHEHGTVIDFNRPPRTARPYEAPQVRLQAPPQRPGGPRLPLAASMAPLVLGIAMFVITKQPTMLLFSLLSPVMAVSTFMSDRRGGRKQYADQLARFRDRAERLREELEEMRRNEIAIRRLHAPDPATLAARAVGHLEDLWERRPDHDDFLTLRVGTADQTAEFDVEMAQGGEPEERVGVEREVARARELHSVPLPVALREAGAIGLSGDRAQVDGLARWLVVQAATLHSPRDLLVFAVLSEERAREWGWLAWLPHAASTRTVVDHANIAVGEGESTALLRALSETIETRRGDNQQRFGTQRVRPRPQLLLLVDEDVAPPRAVIDELLSDASENDLAAVWLGRDRRHLPGGCGAVAELEGRRAAMEVVWPREGRVVPEATPDAVDLDIAEEVARSLAPVRDATAGRSGAAIPRTAPMLELLDLPEIVPADVAGRWSRAEGQSLLAPVGRSADGVLSLDLRRDGPHGLVAGTTGAGKSELLQSLVAGLALNRPPDRVSFLFVDYKGGAAFKDCVELPHTVGMVTDLDAHLTRRALVSLNAELRRREHILFDAGAKDLLQLEQRRPEDAPASLVIVIDEFAALKTEVPEFVDGVVDIAQRGRSLGVHLVLATQRPGGIVSENIKANTNLRIALRVQNVNDSEDVLDDPAAGRISKALPGRAYARTGHGELTEFQSAFVGGHTPRPGRSGGVAVTDLALGEPLTNGARPSSAGEDEEPTDLERIVDAVVAASRELGVRKPPAPWLPELPDTLSIDDLDAADADPPYVVPVGLLDEPSRQRQSTWSVDLERDGHVLIYGTSGSGKTNLLRTIAVQLARRLSPRHLHVYGMDFAGYGLRALEALPHCGSVIVGEDEERVTRLLNTLRREIDARGRLFSDRGVTTLSEFAASGTEDVVPPRIVVLLDSYSGFTAAFERQSLGTLTQALPRIIADGRAVGVHVIATADRRVAVPTAVASLVPQRIVLRAADEDEYTLFSLDRRGTQGANLPPGRGFVDDTLEIQTAIVGKSAAGDALGSAVAAEGAELQRRYPGLQAPPIATMPLDVPRTQLRRATDPALPVIGVDELDLGPVQADLRESAFFVAGPYKSGRSTALITLARSMRDADPDVALHLLGPRRTPLTSDAGFASIARGAEACAERAAILLEAVLTRTPEEEHPLSVIFIDDAGELADGPAAGPLETIARRGRDVNVRIVASCEAGQARGFSPFIRELRKDGNGLLLEPNVDMDGDLLGVRLPRRGSDVFPPGRGFLVADGRPLLVQVARDVA